MDRVSKYLPNTAKPRVIIGIDYGTSFSGAAYSIQAAGHVHDGRKDIVVKEISDWKHKNPYCRYSHKVPSDIGYDQDGKVYCGFDLPESCTRLKWTKLLLETDPDVTKADLLDHPNVKATKAAIEKMDKTPIEVVADFLKWQWSIICETIEEDTMMDEDDIQNSNLTIVMTVPAMWSDMARANTAQAAELAGFAREGWTLKFITEPEAAAISELHDRMDQGLSEEDCFILCDGGGGTVDLVSFQIRKGKPFTLDQKTVATGGLCGSIFIDQMFEAQLKSMLQDDWEKLSLEARKEILDRFAFMIKPSYDGESLGGTGTIMLPVAPNVKFDHIEQNTLRIPIPLVHSAFESVVPRIQSLIDEQEDELEKMGLRPKLKGILLVGGLGCCSYLKTKIARSYSKADKIRVFKGKESWTSVVTGAVRCELMSLGNRSVVNFRLSRWNYGFRFSQRFDPNDPDHRPENVYDCRIEQGVRKVKLVAWIVRKGQELRPRANPEAHEFVWLLKESDFTDDKAPGEITLIRSPQNNAPNWPTEAVKDFVELQCSIPKHLVERHGVRDPSTINTPGKQKVWRVAVTVEISVGPAMLSFDCRIGGQSIGFGKVSYRATAKPSLPPSSTTTAAAAAKKNNGVENGVDGVGVGNGETKTKAKTQEVDSSVNGHTKPLVVAS